MRVRKQFLPSSNRHAEQSVVLLLMFTLFVCWINKNNSDVCMHDLACGLCLRVRASVRVLVVLMQI